MPDDRVSHTILFVPELPYTQWRKLFLCLKQLYLRRSRKKTTTKSWMRLSYNINTLKKSDPPPTNSLEKSDPPPINTLKKKPSPLFCRPSPGHN